MANLQDDLLVQARQWWRTGISDIEPNRIHLRGYPIQELIGSVSLVEMIWLMTRGDLPNRHQAALLEAALVSAVDHGPQAPSIAIARMSITCGVGLNNAMASGINVLGDIHGGAGQQAMELYGQIAALSATTSEPVALETILGARLAARQILPGFGHRFHKVDPRAVKLGQMVENAANAGHVSGQFLGIARAVEHWLSARKSRPVPMNIDGITAVVFAELGFSPMLGRGLFILSRSVGILSHAVEQVGEQARIKGPMPVSIPYTYEGPQTRHLPGDDHA